MILFINNYGGVRSQESGGKREERITTGEEGESFFITNYPDMILERKGEKRDV
ncbi:MAG: hypothetical protein F6K54_13425 [Okeania sp. SIO3B5]|nr:hypothetical protein [Okeania sp. SIO3B5]